MLLMIDNYDSFTYNLVQYFEELGTAVTVYYNDCISVSEVLALNPQYVVISPGPGHPAEAGITVPLIQAVAGKIPLLGVCLGHQAMGLAFGGRIVLADQVMHGKTSVVFHEHQGIFRNIPNAFTATRYHSLLIDRESLPADFHITAWTQTPTHEFKEIMGIRHRFYPLEGVQFHPESILTKFGHQMLSNFLNQGHGLGIYNKKDNKEEEILCSI